uniref:Uncharacterized protein n=1 Tax=Rhizophora mucronata TaxID=61149 RepID=A0A2P2NAU0_RHIMU
MLTICMPVVQQHISITPTKRSHWYPKKFPLKISTHSQCEPEAYINV